MGQLSSLTYQGNGEGKGEGRRGCVQWLTNEMGDGNDQV